MCGNAARDVYADRGDLAVGYPHACVVDALIATRARLDSVLAERRHDRRLHLAQVGADVDHAHYRVADELPGAVVGDLAAAVGGYDLDAVPMVEVTAEGQLIVGGSATARVYRRVFQEQQRVRPLVGLALGLHFSLDGERIAVGNRAQMADANISGGLTTSIHIPPLVVAYFPRQDELNCLSRLHHLRGPVMPGPVCVHSRSGGHRGRLPPELERLLRHTADDRDHERNRQNELNSLAHLYHLLSRAVRPRTGIIGRGGNSCMRAY